MSRRNRTPHNTPSIKNPETSLKTKLRNRSREKSARARYVFTNAQLEQNKFKKLYDHMILNSEFTTLSIGQAQHAYDIALKAAKIGKYNKAMIFFMLAAATILTYSPKTPNTTGFEDTANVISNFRLPQGNLAAAVEYKAKTLFSDKIKNLEDEFNRPEWRELKKQQDKRDRKTELKKKADELQALLADNSDKKTCCKDCNILGGGGKKEDDEQRKQRKANSAKLLAHQRKDLSKQQKEAEAAAAKKKADKEAKEAAAAKKKAEREAAAAEKKAEREAAAAIKKELKAEKKAAKEKKEKAENELQTITDEQLRPLLKNPGLTRRNKPKAFDNFIAKPPGWVRNYLYGRQYAAEDDDYSGDKIWIVPSKYIKGDLFERPARARAKIFNLLRIPKCINQLFISGRGGEWKIFDDKKDTGFPDLIDARKQIEELDIFKPSKKEPFKTEKDFNLALWVQCNSTCFDTIIKLIKNEIHSTVFMLRFITNSLITNNPQARVKFAFTEKAFGDDNHIQWDKLTGLWKADQDKFKLLPLEHTKKKPRLIMSYGPSASGKTFNAKKIIELIHKSDDKFPSAFMAVDGGIAREMSAIYQMVVNTVHTVKNKMSGLANLVTAGLSFHKSLFNSEPKEQIKNWLKIQAKLGYISLYIPSTATGELAAKATFNKANKMSKWEGLNDTKWIGLLIYQHKTHSECPFRHEFKCVGCTESGVKRQIGEGKEYSNAAYNTSMNHSDYAMKHAPGGKIKIHNSGGFKFEGEFARSIITEYGHGDKKNKFLLANQQEQLHEENSFVYLMQKAGTGLFGKDIAFTPNHKKYSQAADAFFECVPPECQMFGGCKNKTRRNRSNKYNKRTRKRK
jgi:hypothetical protein